MNIDHLRYMIDDIDACEANDWEDTTREERYWMQEYRALAIAYLDRSIL